MRQETILRASDQVPPLPDAARSNHFFALRHGLTGLVNALLRETGAGQIRGETLHLPLPKLGSGAALRVSLRPTSRAGRHGFGDDWRRLGPAGEEHPIPAETALDLILRGADLSAGETPVQRENLLARARASVAAVADFLDARRPWLDAALAAPPTFLAAEQALLLGHPVHPAPKTRAVFDGEEARYAPELGARFPLVWLSVAPEALAIGEAEDGLAAQALTTLYGQPVDAGRWPMPMHPWQWARLQRVAPVAELLAAGLVRELPHDARPWWPTASVRSLWAPHADYMVKVSLSVQMTNSLRVLRRAEVERGRIIHKLLASPVGATLRQRFLQFRFLGEPVYALLRDRAGRDLPDSLVTLRENPIRSADAPLAMLASLCQDGPFGGPSWVVSLIGQVAATRGLPYAEAAGLWFERFLTVAIAPVLLTASDVGLLFGAHQQNLLIGLKDGLPETAMFRDCQGTAYVKAFEADLAVHLPDLPTSGCPGVSSEAAAKLVSYYIILNAVFLTIAAIARSDQVAEAALFTIWRRFLEALAAGERRDRSLFDLALTSPTLTSKCNFRIALGGFDEAGASVDPLSLYHAFPNPLVV